MAQNWWQGQQQGQKPGPYGQGPLPGQGVPQPGSQGSWQNQSQQQTQPTSGYGSYGTPQVSQQSNTVGGGLGTTAGGGQQNQQQAGGGFDAGVFTSIGNRIHGWENQIRSLEEKMKNPRTAQQTAGYNSKLARLRQQVASQRSQLGQMGGQIAESFGDDKDALDKYMNNTRGSWGSGVGQQYQGENSDMLWNLLSQGVQGGAPDQTQTWQGQDWTQW